MKSFHRLSFSSQSMLRYVARFTVLLLIAVCLTAPVRVSAQAQSQQPSAKVAPPRPSEIKVSEIHAASRVVFVEGAVNVIGTNKQSRAAKVGDTIFEGDTLVTGKDGELHMDMEDGGYMSVRPNTRLTVQKYQAQGEPSDTSVIQLVQGSFRAITGWIGKLNQQAYQVRTASATIGIRGTDHEPFVIPKVAQDGATFEGEPGTYDKVNIGGSTIRTVKGAKADVDAGKAGFVGHDAKPPRLLSQVPKFFRAARNERLIEGRHAAIQERIMQRRDARRAEVKMRLDSERKRDQQLKEQRREHRQEKREQRKEERQ